MAHFQVPNTTYRPEFKALKFRHCLLIELYGGTGQSGTAEKLDVSIKDSSVAKHTELAWNKAAFDWKDESSGRQSWKLGQEQREPRHSSACLK
jgi:hypothetical protein